MKSPADRKRRSRPLRQDEQTLWKTVVRSVAPLKPRRHADPKPAPLDADKQEGPPSRRPMPGAPAASARKAAPSLAPLGRRMRQRLVRGSEPIERRIDLHGMTQDRAHRALARFLHAAHAEGARTVLVVTGKGGRAGDEDPFAARGVLKRVVPQWLRLPELRGLVLGFEPAHASHGGEGALYVRLRRKRGAD